MLPVKVIKVENASSFIVCETSESDEVLRFRRLEEQMIEHFSNEQTAASRPEYITDNAICIGYCSSLMKWCRVKIIYRVATARGFSASCFLLDYGTENVLIPYAKLREGSDVFLSVPYQALQCRLHGIHPICFVSNPDNLSTSKERCDVFTEAATTFVRQIVEVEAKLMMTILKRNPHGQLDVVIFTNRDGRWCSLAGQLVTAGYAVFEDGETPDAHTAAQPRKSRLITRSSALAEDPPKKSPLMALIEAKPKALGRGQLLQQLLQQPSPGPSPLNPVEKSEESGTSDTERKKLKARLPRRAKTSPGSRVLSRSQFRAFVSEGKQDPEIVAGLKAGDTGGLSSDDGAKRKSILKKSPPANKSASSDFDDMPPLEEVSVNGSFTEQVASPLSHHEEEVSFGYQADLDLTVSPQKEVQPTKEVSFDFGCDISNTTPPRQLNDSALSVQSEESEYYVPKSPVKNSALARPDLSVKCEPPVCEPIVEEQMKFSSLVDSTDDDEGQTLRPTGIIEAPSLLQTFIGSTAKPKKATKKSVSDAQEISPDEEGVHLWSASGLRAPKPYRRVDEAPFSGLVKRYFVTGDRLIPTKLQRYAWPAIVRGYDVVAVAASIPVTASRPGQKAGKTLAYLLPLLSQLMQPGFTDGLPRTNGPLLTILCSKWRTVLEVSEMCEKILGHSNLKVQKLFGGINEETYEVSLINGCDIFISTPRCLLRMLNKQILTCRRLCFLVLEEADVLVDQFTPELEEVLNFRTQAVKMTVMSSTWTSALRCFVAEHLQDALFIITTLLEAAIFGRVQQIATVCPANEKITQVLGIVDPNTQETLRRCLIVCSDTAETVELYKVLTSQSLYTLCVPADLPQTEVDSINTEWNLPHSKNSAPILVCCDEILKSMEIANVEVIIHFSTAKDSRVLGARLWCARQMFLNPFLAEDNPKQSSRVISHLLLSESQSSDASALVRLLQRCDVEIPRKLFAMRDLDLLQKEGSKQGQLCPRFKAFGHCSRQKWCLLRHSFYEAMDGAEVPLETVQPPTAGEVKILITDVKDASCFSARILSHTNENGTVADCSAEYTKLTLLLGMHLSNAKQAPTDLVPVVGHLYGWKDPNLCYHRVKVLVLTTQNLDDRGIPSKAQVHFVDSGEEKKVASIELLPLPKSLTSIPHQVIEVIICRVQPVDKDQEWTPRANLRVVESVIHQELHGVIVLSVGGTLWLDPLVIRETLQYLKQTTNKLNVSNLLLEEDMAIINPAHLHLLYAECHDKLKIPEALIPDISPTKAFTTRGRLATLRTVEFVVDEDFFIDVNLTSVQDPDQVFLRFTNQNLQLEEINAEACEYVQLNTQPPNFSLIPDLLVIAKHTVVGSYCRGRVVELLSEGEEVDIFFVDYGEIYSVPLKDVHPMPDSLFNQTPTLAVECSLLDVEPVGAEWSDEVGDYLWQSTRVEGSTLHSISLYAQVKLRSKSKYAGRYGYGVVLWQTNKGYDIKINEHLVARRLAKISAKKIEEICYGGAPLNEEISHVCTLAASILQSTDPDEQSHLANKINRIIRLAPESQDEVRQNGSLLCLCQSLPLCGTPDVVSSLVQSIQHLCADNTQNIQEVAKTDLISTLCQMADENHSAIEAIASACAVLVKCESACMKLLQTSGLRIFSHVLSSSATLNEVQANSSLVLLHLASVIKTKDDLKQVHASFLDSVSKEISASENDHVVLNCLKAFQPLALNHPTLRDSIRKSGGVKAVCTNLLTWTNPQMIENGVQLLKSLANNNRFCKDVMVEMEAHKALEIIGKGSYISIEGRKIALELNERLKSMLPSDVAKDQSAGSAFHMMPGSLIKNRPLPPKFLSSTVNIRSEHPQVKWLQDKHNVLLLIIVKGACDAMCDLDDVITLTTNSMKFSLIFQSVKYHCELNLYELVSLSDCQKEIVGNEVRVGLRKVTKGLWPRITKAKQKISYVSVDFDRDIPSDSEDSETGSGPKPPLSLAKVKRDTAFVRTSNDPSSLVDLVEDRSDTSSLSGGSDLEDDIMRDYL